MEKFKARFSFSENQAVKEKVLGLADSTLTAGQWRIRTWPDQEVMCSLANRSFYVSDFLSFVKVNQQKVVVQPKEYINQLYNRFVESAIHSQVETRLVQSNPEFARLQNEYYEGILLFEIMEQEVWNRAGEDSVGQLRYFEQNRNKYQAGERATAVLYYSATEENIISLKELLEKGDTTAVESFLQTKRIKREAGVFQKADKPVLAQLPWRPGLHTTQNNGMYYLARIIEIRPAGPASFEEARPAVISDYQNYLEQQWVNGLKEKFPVSINERGKRYITKKLVR